MSTQSPIIDYYVEIVEYETGDTVKRLGPYTKRQAELVSNGSNINQERFFTCISEEERKCTIFAIAPEVGAISQP